MFGFNCSEINSRFEQELDDEAVILKKEVEEELRKIKCKKRGKCNFILQAIDKRYEPGWSTEITGIYKCTKCNNEEERIIRNCN